MNDGFYECDAIARTEALVNTMAMVKTLKMMLLAFSQSFYVRLNYIDAVQTVDTSASMVLFKVLCI